MNSSPVTLYKLNLFTKILIYLSTLALPLLCIYFFLALFNNPYVSFSHYFIAYFTLLGFLFTLLFSSAYLPTIPLFKYTILLNAKSLIYKNADITVHQFTLLDIDFITQKPLAQVFVLNLKDKTKVLLPFSIEKKYRVLFIQSLIDNYVPNIDYQEKKIKGKSEALLSFSLIIIFFPFFIFPLFFSPYILLLYIITFTLMYFNRHKHIKIQNDTIELKQGSKTTLILKNEITKIDLKHTYIPKTGHYYQCILSTDKTYKLHFDISPIDLYCILMTWKNT